MAAGSSAGGTAARSTRPLATSSTSSCSPRKLAEPAALTLNAPRRARAVTDASSVRRVGRVDFRSHRALLLDRAVVEARAVELRCQRRDPRVERRLDRDGAAGLLDREVAAAPERRDVPPRRDGVAHGPALNRVDDDALGGRRSDDLRILDVVLVVHVRRRIADEEHHLVRALILAPRHAVNRAPRAPR